MNMINQLKNRIDKSIPSYAFIADKAERFRFIVIQCFIFSLPFDRVYSSVILILLGIITFFDLSVQKIKSMPKQFIFFQGVYVLSMLWYALSLHRSQAGFVLEKQMAIVLFPLLLPLAINIDAQKMQASLRTFSWSVSLALLYLFACVAWEIVFDLNIPLSKALGSGIYFNHQFSKPLAIHAGYLSLYVALVIIHLMRSFKKFTGPTQKTIIILHLFLLFAGLFFLASRNTILAVSFILIFVMPFFRLKKRVLYFSVMLLLMVSGFFVVNKIPYLKQRFSSEMVMDLNSNAGALNLDQFKVLEPRFDRWAAAMTLVKKSPLLGYGTGDEEAMLKTTYMHHGLYISYILAFNAHNQYLSVLIKHGLLGLLIFLAILVYYFRLAWRAKHLMYMSFLLLLCIGFFTENILDANKGIFFFALFNTFFGYQCIIEEK